MKNAIKVLVRSIVEKIVKHDYESVLKQGLESRLKVDWVQKAVQEFPIKLTMPPDYGFDEIHLYPVRNEKRWIVEFFLWADNETSNLMIRIMFYSVDSKLRFTLWDIFVA